MNFQMAFNQYYALSVTGVFLLLYMLMQAKRKTRFAKRIKSIKNRTITDAIDTDSPVDDQEQELKDRGITSIEDQFSFFQKFLPIIFFGLWLIFMTFPFLGKLPAAYFSIFLAVVSAIAGLSLRPFLENFFSGLIILIFKSVRIGDTVIVNKHYGLVEEIGLSHCVIKRWDWNRILIPNSIFLGQEVQNLTKQDKYLWAYVEFYISPDANIKEVESLALNAASQSSYFMPSEKPSFWVMEMNPDSIKCWLAAWAENPGDAWELRNEMRTNLCIKLQEAGVDFQSQKVRISQSAI